MREFILTLSFIAALIGMVRFKKLTMPFRLLSLYLLLSVIINVANDYLINHHKTNAPLAHADAITNYLFFAFIYYHLFKNKAIRYFILASIVLITIFFFINGIFSEPFMSAFPSNLNLPTVILYVVFSLLMFKQMLLYPVQVNITKQSVFWYNSAILFFSANMFINLGLMEYYSKHHVFSMIVFYFWNGINIVFNLLVGIAILIDKKETKSIHA